MSYNCYPQQCKLFNSTNLTVGFGDPVYCSGSFGNIYLNLTTNTIWQKNNCWSIIGSIGNNLNSNVDFAITDVGTQKYINVLTNDTNVDNLTQLIISAKLDPDLEGVLTLSPSSTDGNILFTPAPRFLSSAIFGYQIFKNCKTSSSVGKIIVNKSFTQDSFALYVNGTTQIFNLKQTSLTSTPIITLPRTAAQLGTNRGDALIYYADGAVSSIIYFYDNVIGTSYTLTNVSTLGLLHSEIEGLGFDNKRYFLYVGFFNLSSIIQIAVNPYDRYNNLGVQTYSATQINLDFTATRLDMTVQESTGYIYAAAQISSNGDLISLYKINPYDGSTLISVTTIYTIGHLFFTNDGTLYGIFEAGNVLAKVDPTNLAITIVSSGNAPIVTDISELLYGM